MNRMNLGRMSAMFGGTVKGALKDGGANLEKALEGVIDACVCCGIEMNGR